MPTLNLQSFGYKYGLPPAEARWLADARDIDGDVDDGLEALTGLDEIVQRVVMATSAAKEWQFRFFANIQGINDGDLVAIGCKHGRHRSVALVEVLAAELRRRGWDAIVTHRDIDKVYIETDQDDDDSDEDYPGQPATVDWRDTTAKVKNMSKPSTRNWYEIRNAAGDVAEIFIYDNIGEDWWTGEGVTAKAFIESLNQITAGEIHLHLNSPGGSVFDGQAIYNALVRHPAKVTTYVDGLAASIASVIALAGDRVVMAANSLFMIHNPMSSVNGYASDMRKMADTLDKIRDSIAGVYSDKVKLTRDEIVAAMDEETWFSAEEALQLGFASEISAPIKVAAHFDLSRYGFRHAPVLNEAEETTDGPAAEPITIVEAAVEPELDSESAGAADPVASDGASETPTNEAFIPGFGFHSFQRK